MQPAEQADAGMMQDMGLAPVCHLEGGFSAWKAAGYPFAQRRA